MSNIHATSCCLQFSIVIFFPRKRFFDRDVNGVREYFRRRFGYESAGYPTFDELTRDDVLDAEVSCSGLSKEMEKDLLKVSSTQLVSVIPFILIDVFNLFRKQEYGMESLSEDDESDVDENDVDESAAAVLPDDTSVAAPIDENELDSLRRQVDDEVKFSEEKSGQRGKSVNFNIQNYMASIVRSESPAGVDDDFVDAIDGEFPVPSPLARPPTQSVPEPTDSVSSALTELRLNRDAQSDDDLPDDDDDELAEMDPKSRAYRFKLVEKMLSDARSQRSYSTSASTIAPSVIKDRIKKTVDAKEKREQRKRCVAKGEASAVTRVRNDNRATCKEYAGWDF